MPHTVTISDETFSRLERMRTPLMGGLDTVIDLLANFYVRHNGMAEANQDSHEVQGESRMANPQPKEFNPSAPPDLTHTRVLSVELNGRQLLRESMKWNKMLHRAIVLAKAKTASGEELKRLIVVNSVIGKKEGTGYHYLADAGVSVQGQDSNAAWRATFHIVKTLGWSIDVVFAWAHKEGVSNAGVTGRFTFGR